MSNGRRRRGPPPLFPFGSRKKGWQRKRRYSQRRQVFEDARDTSDWSAYEDAEDDPEVAEPKCTHCHRSCRILNNQEPAIRVFNRHVCNCILVCQECVDRDVRRDRNRCQVCRQQWRNIEFEPPIAFLQFIQHNHLAYYSDVLAVILATGVIIRLFIKLWPNFWIKVATEVPEKMKGTSPEAHLYAEYFLYIWGIMETIKIYLIIMDIFRLFIRYDLVPLAYIFYRWLRRPNFHVRDPEPEVEQ